MDVFHRRISEDEAAAIWQLAESRHLLDGAPSAIVHHLELMRSRIASLRDAFPEHALHTVAIKANPLVELLREVVAAGAGLEAASIEEVALARAAGCSGDRILFDSPAKTRDEIRQALAWDVCLNADNWDELERISDARAAMPSRSRIGLRVNPLVGGGAIADTSVASADSKFGVPLDSDGERIVAAFRAHPWLTGLHVHVGSQGCRIEQLTEAARRIARLMKQMEAVRDQAIEYVDLGGGLPTVYRTGDSAPTAASYAAALRDQAPTLFQDGVRLVTEMGRAIQANCGFAVSRVEYVKSDGRDEPLAVIHLGADFLLRTVYRPQDWPHEFVLLDAQGHPKSGAVTPVTIAGPLCFAGDILARGAMLPAIESGDWLVIRDVGAYTLSMWSRHCSRGIPAVLGYDPARADSVRLLRRRELPADVVRFWGLSGLDHGA